VSFQLCIDGIRQSFVVRQVIDAKEKVSLSDSWLGAQSQAARRFRVNNAPPHFRHGFMRVFKEALGVDHQPRNGEYDNGVFPRGVAAGQLVREPIGDLQQLLGKFFILQGYL